LRERRFEMKILELWINDFVEWWGKKDEKEKEKFREWLGSGRSDPYADLPRLPREVRAVLEFLKMVDGEQKILVVLWGSEAEEFQRFVRDITPLLCKVVGREVTVWTDANWRIGYCFYPRTVTSYAPVSITQEWWEGGGATQKEVAPYEEDIERGVVEFLEEVKGRIEAGDEVYIELGGMPAELLLFIPLMKKWGARLGVASWRGWYEKEGEVEIKKDGVWGTLWKIK
jgi:hypothetical protein